MKKQVLYITQEELKKTALPQEQYEQILKKPKLGYEIERHRRLSPEGGELVIQGKIFDSVGEQIDSISPQSCFKGTLKRGDVLIKINDAIISHISPKQKVYIKNEQVYVSLSEFCQDNEEVKIEYFTEVRSEKSTDPIGMMGREIMLEKRSASVTINFLYEILDPSIISQIEKQRIIHLPSILKSKLFNQDHAIEQIYKSIKIYFAGLKDESKPIGSYLFVGPTGTGKTELAKLIAKNLDFNLVRVDMSEYGEKHTVSRLIGSPPSYVGYGDKTILEKEIGNNGKKVVLLLDEMEKAHWDLQKIFLQAMDNSRITLANGVEINFNNTLILMTSNLGTITKGSIGLASEGKILSVDMEEVKSHFLPEFMGRLSGVVKFNPLKNEQALSILEKFLSEFNQSQMISKNCEVVLSSSAKEELIKQGFNQTYGARPLKNALQGEIYEKIADLFLFDAPNGATSIVVDWNGIEFTAKFGNPKLSQFETY
jgi:ATP-dependent Clp protease ATP-binding subunit ClpA